MSAWYGQGVWTRRVAISLPDTDTDAAASDWTMTVPVGLDDFWNVIDASGNELRITNAVGTVLSYNVESFNKTNRTATLELNDVANPAVAHCQLAWLYYGSTSNQGSGAAGAFTPSSPKTGYIELARPGGPFRVRHYQQTPGTTLPLRTFAKSAAEVADLWIYYGGGGRGAILNYNSAPALEGLYYLTQTVENTSGSDQSAMYDVGQMRFVWGPRMGMWARVIVKAGTTATNYTSSVLARQAGPIGGLSDIRAILDTRVGWRVRDNRISS